MQDKYLKNFSAPERDFIFWALLSIIPRGIFQYFLFGWTIGAVLFDMYYLLILHFSILFSMEFLSKQIFKIDIADKVAYYLSCVKYWIFIFPFVPVITLITNSTYKLRIEVFKYIPTFLVENNFLPTGMIFVVPIMLLFLTRHLVRFSGLNWVKAFFIIAIANTISYVLYYQWLLGIFYYVKSNYSYPTAMATYSVTGCTFMLLIFYNLVKRQIIDRRWLLLGSFMVYVFAFTIASQAVKYLLR
ncbi:MAG: hypothetical protein KIS94_01270 [Chitinophagales bacterium]|nr:hypothetical protein [Chitinophagales bacterium]